MDRCTECGNPLEGQGESCTACGALTVAIPRVVPPPQASLSGVAPELVLDAGPPCRPREMGLLQFVLSNPRPEAVEAQLLVELEHPDAVEHLGEARPQRIEAWGRGLFLLSFNASVPGRHLIESIRVDLTAVGGSGAVHCYETVPRSTYIEIRRDDEPGISVQTNVHIAENFGGDVSVKGAEQESIERVLERLGERNASREPRVQRLPLAPSEPARGYVPAGPDALRGTTVRLDVERSGGLLRRFYLVFGSTLRFGRVPRVSGDGNDAVFRWLPCSSPEEDPENFNRNIAISRQSASLIAERGVPRLVSETTSQSLRVDGRPLIEGDELEVRRGRPHELALGSTAHALLVEMTALPVSDRDPVRVFGDAHGRNTTAEGVAAVRFRRLNNLPNVETLQVLRSVAVGGAPEDECAVPDLPPSVLRVTRRRGALFVLVDGDEVGVGVDADADRLWRPLEAGESFRVGAATLTLTTSDASHMALAAHDGLIDQGSQRLTSPVASALTSGAGLNNIKSRLDALRDEMQRTIEEPSNDSSDLSPAVRLYLECALSELKHGVVEACFYNLRLLAQQACAEPDDVVVDKLRRAGQRVGEVEREVSAFLTGTVPDGRRVGELLPEVAEGFQSTIPQLREALSEESTPSAIPPLVDHALAGMKSAADRLREHRISLAELIRRALELEAPRLEAARLTPVLSLTATQDLVHANPTRVRGAIIELLRNAALHREGRGEGEVTISLSEAAGRLVLDVASRPAMPPTADTTTLLEPGIGRRSEGGDGLAGVVQVIREHGGDVDVWFDEGVSTFKTQIRFPLRTPT